MDEFFMKLALAQAKRALRYGEVPVGAVLVLNGEVVSKAYNYRERGRNALYHAEMRAIDRACRKLSSWRLCDCDIYVTLEPCPMCAGAMVNARLRRVVFGACDPKAGAFGSVTDINEMRLNHKVEAAGGVLERECGELLSDFFSDLRKKSV